MQESKEAQQAREMTEFVLKHIKGAKSRSLRHRIANVVCTVVAAALIAGGRPESKSWVCF